MLSSIIDTHEQRDVATCDIPGAFMQSKMEGKKVEGKKVHVTLEEIMVDVMLKIDKSKYKKYVVHEYRKPVLYILLTKALYGTIQAAFLFWKNLTGQLEEWGFKTNPYDFCVANKSINGKQYMIGWHVDDLKISHEDPKVVTKILGMIDARYGQEIFGGKRAPLTITRRKIHDYSGMTLDSPRTESIWVCSE